MDNEARIAAKDAILAEYQTLKGEVTQRIQAQNAVLGWAIIIVGAFVGALTTLKSFDDLPLIVSIIIQPSPEVIGVLALLSCGYTVGLELLLTYWVYQLYMIFRISNYIPLMDVRLKSILEIPQSQLLFSWDHDSPGLRDVLLYSSGRPTGLVRMALVLCSRAQPFTLLVLILAGLCFVALSLWYIVFHYPIFSIQVQIILILAFAIFVVGFAIILLVYRGLHKWSIGYTGTLDAALRDSQASGSENNEVDGDTAP